MVDFKLLRASRNAVDLSYFFDPKEKYNESIIVPNFAFNKDEYTLKDEQWPIAKQIIKWLYENPKSRSPFKRLSGFAGCGKSIIISWLLNSGSESFPSYMRTKRIAVCTFTWKAALVLRSRNVDASSIHSIFYDVEGTSKNGSPIFRRKTPEEIREEFSLIVVDEASMVDSIMRRDIEASGVPVLYVGDGGQLPSISNDPEDAFFMQRAEFNLTTIHRQALDSPIIRLSIDIREGKRIKFGKYGEGVFKVSEDEVTDNLLLKSDQILCGKNDTRRTLNKYIRKLRSENIKSLPSLDEKIIGLTNLPNNGLYNGQFWNVEEDYSEHSLHDGGNIMMRLRNEMDETVLTRCVFPEDEMWKKFTTEAQAKHYMRENSIYCVDYGYAATVHKFQGSSAIRPILFEERFGNAEFHRRWFYTGVTRAVKKLIIAAESR